jgi:hypothetical protein
VAAAGFVIPAIVSVAAALLATAQLAPASVIVTVPLVVDAEAVQLENPLTSVTVGLAGTTKLELKVA